MPRILETDAFALARGIDAMDEAQRPQALDILARYKRQQEDDGEPEWPSQARAEQESKMRLRGFFEDLKTVDAAAPSLASVLPYSQNPDEDRARVANTAYLASRYGKTPDEIGAIYELWRDDYATRFLQSPAGLGDLAFHSAAAKEIQREKQKEETSIEGVKAALRGDDVIPALQAWQAKNLDRMPDSTEFTRGFLQARERAGDRLEFADALLRQIESNVGLTKGDGVQRPTPASRETAAQFEASLATLATMKPKDRKQVYAIIGAKAEAAGYDLKGFWSQMLSELGKGMARMGSTLETQVGVTADVLQNFPAMLTNTMGEEEFAATDESIARRQGIGEMYDEVAGIVAGDVDPVRPVISWLNDTVETGLIQAPGAVAPFMMASAALGPYGAGALFTADFAEQNRRDLRAQGMDNVQAMSIGAAAAPLQAAAESLSNALQLGRFPAVQRALASFTKPIGGGAGAVARYVQNSTLALATEFTEEQIQDNLIVPATQEIFGALSEDVPDVDWSMYRNRAIESTPELLSILVPMALVFGGTMTAAQANLSGALVSSQEMLEAAGYSAAQANEIRIQSTPEAQVSKAREFWGARAGTPQTIEAAAQTVGERMRLLRNDTAAAQADLERRGILPRMLHAAEDRWKLTFNDGSTADFNSHAEADAARWQWATDQLGKVHLATRSALAQLESGAAVGREFAVEFKPDALTAEQAMSEGRVDMAQLERRVAQGEAVGETAAEPVNEADAFDAATLTDKATSDYLSSLQILGSSVNQFKDGVLRTTIRLYEGANVLTLVEEKLEGDAKQIVESRPGREWLLKSLREYERVSGDKLFRDVADDSQLQNDDLIEAWSSLGQSYLVGKSKKGAAIGKGGARRIFADVLKAGMAGAMNSETQFFNAVWRRAAKLSKLNREGKLGADLTEELERQLGIDSQTRIESEIAAEAEAIANEALYAGGASYSEENPGPNGETFSIAPSLSEPYKDRAGEDAGSPLTDTEIREGIEDEQGTQAESLIEIADLAESLDDQSLPDIPWGDSMFTFSLAPGLSPWKQLTRNDLKKTGKKGFAFYADRMRVGTYRGLDPRSGIKIPLQGGFNYPAQNEMIENDIAWAVSDEKTVKSMITSAKRTGGHAIIALFSRGNITGNATFLQAYFEELRWNIKQGKITEQQALKFFHEAKQTSGVLNNAIPSAKGKTDKETGEKIPPSPARVKEVEARRAAFASKKWKTLEEVEKVLGSLSFKVRGFGFFKTVLNKNAKRGVHVAAGIMGKQQLVNAGMPDVAAMVELMEEPAFTNLPLGTIVGIVDIDPDQKVQTAEELGVTPHKSYPYVVRGKRVGVFKKEHHIEDFIPLKPKSSRIMEGEAMAANITFSLRRLREDFQRTSLVTADHAVAMLGDFPAYLDEVVSFMSRQREKAINGEFKKRDIAKAYLITLGSIGASAINVSTFEGKTGIAVPANFKTTENGIEKIRPEEAVALWFGLPQGKAALDAIDAGTATPEMFEDLLTMRDAYGRNDIRNNGFRLGGSKATLADVGKITDAINEARGNVEKISDVLQTLTGISHGKIGFIKHLLGFGDAATVDAVELNFWITGEGKTGQLDSKRADLVRRIKAGGTSIGAVVAKRIQGQIARVAKKYDLDDRFAAHVIHHWLWDAAKKVETTHEGMMHSMETFSLRRKFDFSSKLAPAAEMLRNMRQSGKAFDFATAYRAASAGQSTSMLPLAALYDEAKKQVPALTEADFGKQVQALYDSGNLLLEPGERADSMRETLGRFGVRDSLGIPAMFARPMEQETFSITPGYGIEHRPREDGPRAFDLAEGNMMPSDVYQHPEWYSAMEPKVIRETMAQLRKVKGNPNAKLTIYRAGPKGEMNSGDWVSLSKTYAASHAMSQDPGEYKVWSAQVEAENVRWAMDDLSEFGYFGERVSAEDTGATFSLRSGDFASRMAAAFSPFQRNPELRMAIAQVAKQRAQRLGAEWIEKSAVLRTSASIAKEQGIREALGYDERLNAYLESLTPSARQELEFEPAALDDDPLVSAMLDHGKLMSQSTAKREGKVDAKAGDYDGAPWLPPAWYSSGGSVRWAEVTKDGETTTYTGEIPNDVMDDIKSGSATLKRKSRSIPAKGGIMPDQMAQAMFDAGLLPDAFTGTLWAALESRIASTKKNKTAHREAVQAYNAAKRTARTEAKAEAEAWAKQTRKAAGSPKAQRDMLKAALRTLDGILSAAPPEVRARVGGYVKLAGLATDEAMLQEIERRIEKLNVELEKWLKKEGVAEIQKLLKRGRPEAEAGKRGKGKDPDMHALFAAAERAIPMNAEAVAGELARLDTLIGGDTLTPEQEALAVTERGIVELVGDLKSADSGRVFSALDTLREIYEGGWLKWKLAQIEKREERAGQRADFIADTGKSGIKPERDAADKAAVTLLGKIKGGFLSLSSFQEVLSYAFGSKSERVASLVDAEREASGQYEDVTQALADEVESLFADLAGGSVLAGERLRYDMAQRTIKTGKGELSQLEAIQALLMWRQEDGRRHMEGAKDENGKPIGTWNYDQAWIDEITAALTSEARSVMAWLSQKYAAEHPALNALYRERYGVNMPAHDNYAPITVQPVQTKSGEVNDPVSGAAISSGSILVPGSLRARSRSAIAEPDFRDALQTFMAHTRQLEYWKAYYDLAFEANAILGNREVLNAVKAKGGEPAATALRKWIDAIAQGGFRDASASLGLHKLLSRMTGRAASVGLLGRFSTLLVQSTQLGAASVKMPVGAYLIRLSKLLTGNLSFRDAINSPFIQRRYKSAPPIVRQALEGLGVASRPNQITRATLHLGNLLSGADAMFTAGTYAMLLDYHRGTGRALGLSGAELETHAHTEAERDTEAVAQPTRMATRSLAEITSTNPLAKVSWAYASEARQKIALMAWATMNAKAEPAQFARTAFLVFGVGGLMTQVLKNLWREAKGDDDESKWAPERLTLSALAGPLHGVPLASELMGDQGMLSGVAWAWPALKDVVTLKGDMRDVDTLLSTMGLFNDTAAGIASLSHAGLDAAKVLENLASEK